MSEHDDEQNKTPSVRVPRERYSDEMWAAIAWAYEDEEHTRLSDDFCTRQRAAALENFDLNMAFIAQIPKADFDDALTEMLARNKRGFGRSQTCGRWMMRSGSM